jgi:hypothetical protein
MKVSRTAKVAAATKATAVPAKKGSLSSIVADWDDE